MQRVSGVCQQRQHSNSKHGPCLQQQQAAQGEGYRHADQGLPATVRRCVRLQYRQCSQQRDAGEAGCLHGRQASEKQSDKQQAAEAAPAEAEGQPCGRLGVSQSQSHGPGQHAAGQR